MLVLCYELFRSRPDILKMWQEKFHYILIDEFQDINQIQYDVIRMLAEPQSNLFAVGDDDQAIYGFRGVDSRLMFRFTEDYPEAKQLLLDINYLSLIHIYIWGKQRGSRHLGYFRQCVEPNTGKDKY